ncbi:ATP-binding cassette domain-containing protein [Peptoniphilus sp. KCTC 25270]|uniref:ABC transporter ATP-binding protein n=1 Tax=Peptoniphilus sp. KCTC 25270 TaxID=2897414 RepID=UPI001E596426|nr:ATP-binding cassette domain-containing protein [Peptoniphilus sp. KCTC 25270]MCD1147390.1 ATP-binding cassette domain-containing protein [Peptoniphilus sp. KCTC 25270]
MEKVLLRVENVSKSFPIGRKTIFGKEQQKLQAVKNVSFQIKEGETLGIVGESGSGKSTLARCIMRLYDDVEGKIYFEDKNILEASKEELREIRKEIQMIFQDPYSSLNPRMTAGQIVSEPLINLGIRENIKERVMETIKLCGLDEHHYYRYPHEFSGGQRQRLGIARALIVQPKLIVADEPTSALDVSIQAQIINLLEELQEKLGLSYIFISHNLAVVEHISDKVGVMLKGEMVEMGEKEGIYKNPQHDYTKTLLRAIPVEHPSQRKR